MERSTQIKIKKAIVIGVAVAIPVTIFVLFKSNRSLTDDFSSLYNEYAELKEANAVLKDQYLTLTDGYLKLADAIIDRTLTVTTELPISEIAS